ncbi:hypothetical protein D3C71_1546930 [compost metagenome]
MNILLDDLMNKVVMILDTEKLYDALDGMFAYDTGCVDSGIKDERLREEIKTYFFLTDDETVRLLLSRFIREYFLTEEKLDLKYGIEDVSAFIKWLNDYMEMQL